MAKDRQQARREAIRAGSQGMMSAAPASGSKAYLKIPEGLPLFQPEAEKTYYFRFLPWKAGPFNRSAKKEGDWVWNYFFQVHSRVGLNDESYTCMTTYGKLCAMCAEFQRLQRAGVRGDKAYYQNVLSPIRNKNRELFLVHDMNGPKDNIMVWEESTRNFGDSLREKIDFNPDKYDNIADSEGGWIVAFKPKKETTGSADYVKTTMIELQECKTPVSDAIYEVIQTIDVDSFVVRPAPNTYERLLETRHELPAGQPSGPDAPSVRSSPRSGSLFPALATGENDNGEEEGFDSPPADEEPEPETPPVRQPRPAASSRTATPPPRPAAPARPGTTPSRPAARQPAPEPADEDEPSPAPARPARGAAPTKPAAPPKPAPAPKPQGRKAAAPPEPEAEDFDADAVEDDAVGFDEGEFNEDDGFGEPE